MSSARFEWRQEWSRVVRQRARLRFHGPTGQAQPVERGLATKDPQRTRYGSVAVTSGSSSRRERQWQATEREKESRQIHSGCESVAWDEQTGDLVDWPEMLCWLVVEMMGTRKSTS